ncbi:hypothetical protein K7432_018260 [Basidiobolus ranarum]|uniref:Uncharacterized protein n=1 Tax=Basidiobolus ranarum TaxID=34480 RepID=A0ABR2WCE4_9FUNG
MRSKKTVNLGSYNSVKQTHIFAGIPDTVSLDTSLPPTSSLDASCFSDASSNLNDISDLLPDDLYYPSSLEDIPPTSNTSYF